MAATLGTLLITACGEHPGQFKPITPDRARYAACLGAKIVLPTGLKPLSPFTVPAGTVVAYPDGSTKPLQQAATVVLQSVVHDRDADTSAAYLSERAGRQTCQSAAQYTVDWIDEVSKP